MKVYVICQYIDNRFFKIIDAFTSSKKANNEINRLNKAATISNYRISTLEVE